MYIMREFIDLSTFIYIMYFICTFVIRRISYFVLFGLHQHQDFLWIKIVAFKSLNIYINIHLLPENNLNFNIIKCINQLLCNLFDICGHSLLKCMIKCIVEYIYRQKVLNYSFLIKLLLD